MKPVIHPEFTIDDIPEVGIDSVIANWDECYREALRIADGLADNYTFEVDGIWWEGYAADIVAAAIN